jgi:hypothetical protein
LFDFLQTDDTERRQKETQALEQAATVVRVYQPLVIPGILQTDEYARSVLYLSGVTNEEAAERGLAARRRRRQALDRAEKRFRFIIGEAALRNRVCSNTTMIDQIEHLKAVNGKTTVSLSVLPWSTRLRTLILSSLYIFDESSLYIELTHGELRQTRAADVHFYVQRFNDAEKIALTGFEAEQVLSRIARDYQRLEELEQSAGATVF